MAPADGFEVVGAVALCVAHQEPLVFPTREQVEARLQATTGYWRRWAARPYDGS